jgi:isopenicillin N synthase-like dioxygenase
MSTVPIIDISPLGTGNAPAVAAEINRACRTFGFFYIVGHGVDEGLQQQLEEQSRLFFEQDLETKLRTRMALSGRAWRGYFPVGDELTSGKPDIKEGLYFGIELDETDPRVRAGLPLHGRNLFPDHMPLFRQTVLDYMGAMTRLGHTLMTGLALSLGLESTYFAEHYTGDPLTLFRIFHYPPVAVTAPFWGVGEHTDYGVLTILKQDDIGGLQVKSRSNWIDAPPVPGSFVCNIGDMLDRMTGGLYRSTLHRVRNVSNRSRYSFPLFFDPNFDARIQPIDLSRADVPQDDYEERWDRSSVHTFEGTYGDYILNKVSRVFPELVRPVIEK